MTKFIAAIGLATAAAFALALPAQANDKKYGVAACSKNNTTNCKTGAVQNYNMGQKVRLPGGTWVDCAGDCQDELRQKTVDFWAEQMDRN
jgi:hypothetical protein